MRNVSDKSCREISEHILCSVISFCFSKIAPFARKCGKIFNGYWMVNAHCMLDTQGYKHTLIICSTYCFSIVEMIVRTAPHRYDIRTLPVLQHHATVWAVTSPLVWSLTHQRNKISYAFTFSNIRTTCLAHPIFIKLTLILPRSRTGTVWFYTSTSNKRAARPKRTQSH